MQPPQLSSILHQSCIFNKGRARKTLGTFMTAHHECQIGFPWSKLHHIQEAPHHSFPSMLCDASDKDNILCVTPCHSAGGKLTLQSHPKCRAAAFLPSLSDSLLHTLRLLLLLVFVWAVKTHTATPGVQRNSSGNLLAASPQPGIVFNSYNFQSLSAWLDPPSWPITLWQQIKLWGRWDSEGRWLHQMSLISLWSVGSSCDHSLGANPYQCPSFTQSVKHVCPHADCGHLKPFPWVIWGFL